MALATRTKCTVGMPGFRWSDDSQKKPGGIAPAGPCMTWGDFRAYRSSDSTLCWLWLAWAIIAVEAWLRIWAFDIAVVSIE